MKKLHILLISAVLSLLALSEVQAQNLQVMYDTDRGCVTSTIEMFRPDKFGSTYFFGVVDFQPILDAEWFAFPAFVCPEICWEAIIFIFGTIASLGVNTLVKNNVDLGNTRNLVLHPSSLQQVLAVPKCPLTA